MARAAARRRRGRAVRGRRDRAGSRSCGSRAAELCDRQATWRRAGTREVVARARARWSAEEPLREHAARPADARALSLRPPGGGARRLPRRARRAGGGDRRRARAPSCGGFRGDPPPGPGARAELARRAGDPARDGDARRAGAAADRERALRAAEDDLAGGVVELQVAARARGGRRAPSSCARTRAWPPSSLEDADVLLRAGAARRGDGRAARGRAVHSASSGRRAAASPPRCAPACWRRWRGACCPAARAGRTG